MKKTVNVLFMCVANSARSQMAEGLARKLLGPGVHVESAGSRPSYVNPYAEGVMKEIGLDISRHHSKAVLELPASFLTDLDYVITLCAEEVCPVVVSKAKKLHWPLPDPAGQSGDNKEQLERFRATRDALSKKLSSFKSQLEKC